jgi:hypothetical protein
MLWPFYAAGTLALAIRPQLGSRVLLPLLRILARSRRQQRSSASARPSSATCPTFPPTTFVLPRSLSPLAAIQLGMAIQSLDASPPSSPARSSARSAIATILNLPTPALVTPHLVSAILHAAKLRSGPSWQISVAASLLRAVGVCGTFISVAPMCISIFVAVSPLMRSLRVPLWPQLAVGYYASLHLVGAGIWLDTEDYLMRESGMIVGRSPFLSLCAYLGAGLGCALMVVEERDAVRRSRENIRLATQERERQDFPDVDVVAYGLGEVADLSDARRWRRFFRYMFLAVATGGPGVLYSSRFLATLSSASLFAGLWPREGTLFVANPSSLLAKYPGLPACSTLWVMKAAVHRLIKRVNVGNLVRVSADGLRFRVFGIGAFLFGPLAFNLLSVSRWRVGGQIHLLIVAELCAGLAFRNTELLTTAVVSAAAYVANVLAAAVPFDGVMLSICAFWASSALLQRETRLGVNRIVRSTLLLDNASDEPCDALLVEGDQ